MELAETGPGPGWSDEEGPLGFWATLSVLLGTLKWSSSELYERQSVNQHTQTNTARFYVLSVKSDTSIRENCLLSYLDAICDLCVNRKGIRK